MDYSELIISLTAVDHKDIRWCKNQCYYIPADISNGIPIKVKIKVSEIPGLPVLICDVELIEIDLTFVI